MKMDWKQRALARLMSDISEEKWCAGWLTDLEYLLWAKLVEHDVRYRNIKLDAEQMEDLKSISEEINGWIVHEIDGVKFIPLDEWSVMYNDWLKRCS